MSNLDSIDRAIIAELEGDGRMAINTLADRVGLSASPCLRRVRKLEDEGVITGYRAIINGAAVGRGLVVWATARLGRHDSSVYEFEEAIAAIDAISSVHHVTGDVDYLIRVEAEDLDHYDRLVRTILPALPGEAHLTSYVVTSIIKDDHR